MRRLIKNGLVYRNASRSFLPMDILTEGKYILSVGERGEFDGIDASVVDACGMRLTSGLIDVHTHGICGMDFLGATKEDLKKASKGYLLHGVTAVMPTLASAPLDVMVESARAIGAFKENDGADFCGVHIEGRYLNPAKRGAHAEELLSALSADELSLFEALGLPALHISAALELDTSGEFIKKAKSIGATLALGHTMASYSTARALEEKGVSAYAHLFNAMPPLHHRDGGAVAACLLGDAYGEMICDGIHISPETVALAYRMKKEKLTLISDSMEATDRPDGNYSIAGNPVRVENGIARTLDGALAGSTLTLDKAVANLMSFCSLSLEDAIISATEAPAREIGIFDAYGSLDVGKIADILFISADEFKINAVIKNGGEPITI